MRYLNFIKNNLNVQSLAAEEASCSCPFHADTRPSFRINIRTGLWICHGCGEKGNIEKLGKLLNVDVVMGQVSTKYLRGRLKEIKDSGEPAHEPVFLPEDYLKMFEFPHNYWKNVRGFSDKAIQEWQLGYNPFLHSGTIPMRDKNKRLLGVIQRNFGPAKPKYVYPENVRMRDHLFGLWKVRSNKIAIVEGSLDCIACWDARVPAVALLGSRITRAQVQLLHEAAIRTVVVLTDADTVGREAVQQVKESLRGIQVLVGWYRPSWAAKDPAELTEQRRRKIYHSAKMFRDWKNLI